MIRQYTYGALPESECTASVYSQQTSANTLRQNPPTHYQAITLPDINSIRIRNTSLLGPC